MPYCPQCGRYHTPDTGGCRFQTTITEPTESALAAKDARELAGKIVRDYHKPDMYKMDRDAIAAEIERFVEAQLAAERERANDALHNLTSTLAYDACKARAEDAEAEAKTLRQLIINIGTIWN